MAAARAVDARVRHVTATAYTIPTDLPEADGTYAWDSTTIVVVEIEAGGEHGLGYTYASASTALLVNEALAEVVEGLDGMDVPAAWLAMVRRIRNLGRPGISAMAISGVDAALWDLKAKLLGVSLAALFGRVRERVPVYGSGGFTSYSDDQLARQLSGWAEQGIRAVKMKVGQDPERDPARVTRARQAIGRSIDLFVDANGAYSRKQALALAGEFAAADVRWFEEPVSSDDLEGLRLLRDRAPAVMDVAAGEYGYTAEYFHRMLQAQAVDVLQADATRCLGLTGFLQAAALCDAEARPLSAHCAPALHVTACCALPAVRHMEYFHDHVRIERMLFDGGPQLVNGCLEPDLSRPGLGLELKRPDAARYAA